MMVSELSSRAGRPCHRFATDFSHNLAIEWTRTTKTVTEFLPLAGARSYHKSPSRPPAALFTRNRPHDFSSGYEPHHAGHEHSRSEATLTIQFQIAAGLRLFRARAIRPRKDWRFG
jgi:hypothetical protein